MSALPVRRYKSTIGSFTAKVKLNRTALPATLPGKLVGGISGFIVAAYGYATFFALTAGIAIPVFALIYAVGRSPAGGLRPSN